LQAIINEEEDLKAQRWRIKRFLSARTLASQRHRCLSFNNRRWSRLERNEQESWIWLRKETWSRKCSIITWQRWKNWTAIKEYMIRNRIDSENQQNFQQKNVHSEENWATKVSSSSTNDLMFQILS
jgi:hypothetical protein